MKPYSLFRSVALTLLILGLSTSCKKKPNDDDDKADFDRKSMLTNIGNNIIIPNYQTLNNACNKLDSTVTDFNTSPDNTKLLNLQNKFKDAYRAWQLCSSLNFGPSDQQNLKSDLNIFPTDTTKIKPNITSGSYNLDALVNSDAKGFPAIDYLLFGTGPDILGKYTTDSEAAKRKQYLANLSVRIKTKVNTVLNAWLPSGGNYINTFINASGTDAGSSASLLVNELDHDLDDIKNYKLGTPLGHYAMGPILPYKVEAYYSGISSELILIQMQNIQNIYLGKSGSTDGLGFDDYLVYIHADYLGGSLDEVIKAQLNTVITKITAAPDPLSVTIQNNQSIVEPAYTEIQKLLVRMKSDMTSKLHILINYQDGDGD